MKENGQRQPQSQSSKLKVVWLDINPTWAENALPKLSRSARPQFGAQFGTGVESAQEKTSLKPFLNIIALAVLVMGTFVPPGLNAMQAPAPASDKAKASKGSTAAPPSAQEIADAKSKGMVWVNLSTHVYHKDGAFYGTTKHGKFMTEDEATKAGNRAVKEPGTKKKAATAK
jgi:hypothetical protein